jgi:hypothetical protein
MVAGGGWHWRCARGEEGYDKTISEMRGSSSRIGLGDYQQSESAANTHTKHLKP